MPISAHHHLLILVNPRHAPNSSLSSHETTHTSSTPGRRPTSSTTRVGALRYRIRLVNFRRSERGGTIPLFLLHPLPFHSILPCILLRSRKSARVLIYDFAQCSAPVVCNPGRTFYKLPFIDGQPARCMNAATNPTKIDIACRLPRDLLGLAETRSL